MFVRKSYKKKNTPQYYFLTLVQTVIVNILLNYILLLVFFMNYFLIINKYNVSIILRSEAPKNNPAVPPIDTKKLSHIHIRKSQNFHVYIFTNKI